MLQIERFSDTGSLHCRDVDDNHQVAVHVSDAGAGARCAGALVDDWGCREPAVEVDELADPLPCAQVTPGL